MKALAAITWASLTALIWLLILGWVEFGNIQLYSLIFFGVVALASSLIIRGDEVRKRGPVYFVNKENLINQLDGQIEALKKEKAKDAR